MDFNSLVPNSPIYIVRKGEHKPALEMGVLKAKNPVKQNVMTPNFMAGMNTVQTNDLVVTVNGNDEVFPSVPLNLEIAKRPNGDVFSGSKEAILQAIDGMAQTSRNELDRREYNETALVEYEKMVETLNPAYAEKKHQAESIATLQKRADAQEKKLDMILGKLDELFTPKK